MSANAQPIYSRLGDIQWGTTPLTTANTAKDGTGTVLTVFTADATNGGYVRSIRFKPAGSNVATVIRIFINNGLTNATPANNIYFDDVTLPLTTLTETAAQPLFELPLNWALPPGYKINVVLGTTVAAGWYVSAVGGKY